MLPSQEREAPGAKSHALWAQGPLEEVAASKSRNFQAQAQVPGHTSPSESLIHFHPPRVPSICSSLHLKYHVLY